MPSEIPIDISSLQDWTNELLSRAGLSGRLLHLLAVTIDIVVLLIVCWLAYRILLKIIHAVVRPWIKRSGNEHAFIFIEKKSFHALAHLASGLLLYYLLPVFFNLNGTLTHTLRVLTVLYIIIMFMIALTRIFHSLEYLGQRSEKFEKKPISSYVQIALIISYLFCGVIMVSFLFNKSPMTIITAFSAGMAIILLIFKDVILGLVASVQVSVNDMVRVGDWISVHNYDADGEVSEINLTSVKVRNWDKSVSNVPTYALVSNGFKNVREMEDLGYRRLMHHLLIDVRTVKEVDDGFIERLRSKGLFSGDVKELSWTGEQDYSFEKVNTITNISLFRRYIETFLSRHPGIDNIYIVVRQLQHTGNGLPLELYAFVKSVSFKPLNYVQSDIFEHLYAVIRSFELDLYQRPDGNDLHGIGVQEIK